jgi:urea transporter
LNPQKLKILFPSFLSSILNSYTQVFFSNNRVFAVILIVVSFFNVLAGVSGLFAVVASNIIAYLIGFNRNNIRLGYYGFNSLLVGLGLGIFYQPGFEYFILLIFVAFLTLFITIMVEGVLGKYGLPFLSISFLLSIWLVTLASRQFTALKVSEAGIYALNDLYTIGGLKMVKLHLWLTDLPIPGPVLLYFRSLGAIFFQYHLVPGILLAIGLLIYSRISFTLSIFGFLSAHAYYHFIGANFDELSYGYIGFNYILTAIAVGGFFIIPSFYSYLWVILLTPLISIILTSSGAFFQLFQLSVFSLPFNIVVVLFLYILKFRERFLSKPQIAAYQQYSPEKNLYSHLNYNQRFGKSAFIPLSLPFMGTWKVTQGHDGTITHKGEWKHAWDFEIADENGKTFSGSGDQREDYYCYNKPVAAPADGWVEELVDNVEENEIGEMNVEQNWGNSVVIRHSDFLFTKLSHLKKGSFKVAAGDHVKKGEIIAKCGNSGRAPVPHVHFQVQATPFIGSKTISYPVCQFMVKDQGNYLLKIWDIPVIGTHVSNIEKNDALAGAFHLIPGQKAQFRVSRSDGEEQLVDWEVIADPGNRTYVWCRESGSKAWFTFSGNLLSFTHFEGDRKSLLYYYYLGAYRILTGFYKGLEITDTFPVTIMKNPVLRFFQDFIAPFHIFIKPEYTVSYERMEDHLTRSEAWLTASVRMKIGNRTIRKTEIAFLVSRKGLEKMTISDKNEKVEVVRIEDR